MWKRLKAEVQAGHEHCDQQIRQWAEAFVGRGGRLFCRKGCSNCCHLAVHAALPEAVIVAERLSTGQADVLLSFAANLVPQLAEVRDWKTYLRQYREVAGVCPFLEIDGACGIYDVRPFACRSLHSTRNPDWCGIDLGQLHPLEKQAYLSGLDPAVTAYPTHYAAAPQEYCQDQESAVIARMREDFGIAVSGNFPLLVWMVREHGLVESVSRGSTAVMGLLSARGVGYPLTTVHR